MKTVALLLLALGVSACALNAQEQPDQNEAQKSLNELLETLPDANGEETPDDAVEEENVQEELAKLLATLPQSEPDPAESSEANPPKADQDNQTNQDDQPDQADESDDASDSFFPTDDQGTEENASPQGSEIEYPSSSDDQTTVRDIIAELKSQIAQLPPNDLDQERGKKLKRLKLQLKLAQLIDRQLDRTRVASGKGISNKKEIEDSYVVARIEVTPGSQVADVTFFALNDKRNNTAALFEFLKATPPGGYRDYRIMSRHKDMGLAEQNLAVIRKEYDLYKEREKKMLEYIAARNEAIRKRHIQRSRRC